MPILELGMMIGFGIAWPVNLYSSIKSKTNEGKNIYFLFTIEFAYILGLINKIFYDNNYVTIVYGLNFLMVTADIIIYFIKAYSKNPLSPSKSIAKKSY